MNISANWRWVVSLRFLTWTTLVLFLISCVESITPPNFGTETDRLALIDFKNRIIDDPGQIMKSWNDSFTFCYWVGVTCNPFNGRVSILNLQSSSLVGSVPPSIGNLTFLTGINLRANGFLGQLPQEFGKLLQLRYLNLSTNSFTGMIPTNLTHCTTLEVLDLISNKLVGSIPDQLFPLSKLLYLGLANNNLTGRIPPWIGNFSSMIALSLTGNKLHGSIPHELGDLRKLTFFQLYGNELSGIIPPSLFNISSIFYFSVTQNQLQGQLPPDLGVTLPNLQVFAAAVNKFTGRVPISLSNASKLQIFDFSFNDLEGSVPPNLGTLRDLSRIYLDVNRLGKGEVGGLNFFSLLANCTNLEVLGLADNLFEGEIPQSIANLSSNLKIFTLSSNLIQGKIPVGIENLINLARFDVEQNYLTGNIPYEIGKLHKLEGLSLYSNKFTGLPSSIGNLTLLTRLFLNDNNLQGSIPESLGGCQNLLVLNLSRNNLSGVIPKVVMGLSSLSISLSMADNSLTGLLPVEVGSLTNLKELNLGGNKLMGEIPTTLGRCQNLESLFMQGNMIEGRVPDSLENLRGLTEIDLSHNNLSGPLPMFFGKLPLLKKLNISYNEFEGEVSKEGVFANASAVYVQGNYRLCGGVPGLNLPVCSSPDSTRKLLAPKVVAPLAILAVAFIIFCAFSAYAIIRRSRKRPSETSSTKYWQSGTSYQELFECTNGFSEENLIGSGGFGTVYKGVIRADNAIVAIKVLNPQQKGASKTFMDEFNALKSIRHRNLLKILSACSSVDNNGNDFQCLVFKFMSNGNLDQWLYPTNREPNMNKTSLSFIQRLNIAIEVAYALDYLHRDCVPPIVHCDLKPSNILLDDDMTAHLADFGLAKILFQSSDLSLSQSITVSLKGSLGYIPPEYAMGGETSTLGDVYSYGILLLEMLTGKRPTDDSFKYGLTLHQMVATALSEHVMDMVDPSLLSEKEGDYKADEAEEKSIIRCDSLATSTRTKMEKCLISLMKIGVSCANHLPSSRMPMYVVVNEMKSIRESFLGTEEGLTEI